MSITRPYPKHQDGWQFPYPGYEYEGSTPDKLFGSKVLSEVYFKADKDYKAGFLFPCYGIKRQGRPSTMYRVPEYLTVFS